MTNPSRWHGLVYESWKMIYMTHSYPMTKNAVQSNWLRYNSFKQLWDVRGNIQIVSASCFCIFTKFRTDELQTSTQRKRNKNTKPHIEQDSPVRIWILAATMTQQFIIRWNIYSNIKNVHFKLICPHQFILFFFSHQ